MALNPVKAESAYKQSEIETAWAIFAALSQYATKNPHVKDDIFYVEFMFQAHKNWSALFAGNGGGTA